MLSVYSLSFITGDNYMSIGSTITCSVPAVGSTTRTLTKLRDGVFAVSETPVAGYPTIPVVATLRPASTSPKGKTFGITLKRDVTAIEDDDNPSLGKATITINIAALLGQTITVTELETLVQEALSILLIDGIFDALVEGSIE
jgi:hypothetical protein